MKSSLLKIWPIFVCCINIGCNNNHSSVAAPDVVGKWQFTGIATDLNNNNLLDSNEIVLCKPDSIQIISFTPAGKMYVTDSFQGTASNDKFSYKLISNNAYLQITSGDPGSTDTTYGFKISKYIPPTNNMAARIIFQDSSQRPMKWYIYTKK